MKTGQRFNWTALYRQNLWRLMQRWRACEIMALWDLYLENDRGTYRLYFMEKEYDRLWMNPRFKPLVKKYDDVLTCLGRRPF